jgi:hypothetical protein
MFKSISLLAVTGVAGLLALKFLGLLLLPLLGMFFGFVMWALKIALIVGLLWFGWHLFQRWTNGEHGAEA